MSRPNFVIVEVSESERDYSHLYDDFKKDFLNPTICQKDLKKKYGIPLYVYREWSAKIREEYGLKKKPVLHGLFKENQYIYKLTHCYGIRKKCGDEMVYFGKYPNLETAKMVRNKLYECNWDRDVAKELKKEYGYPNESYAYLNVIDKYDDFKHLYVDVATPYGDILSKLDISAEGYRILLNELRKEIPNVKKNRKRCYGKPAYVPKVRYGKRNNEMKYIQTNKNNYTVNKVINGVHKSFGTYKSLESAKKRRAELESNGWKL